MLTPSQLVHAAHGSPAVDGCEVASGRCYVCVGELTRGRLIANWLSGSFTDQNRARCPSATHVCEACCYAMSRTSPVLGRPAKEGKKFGGNFRNYAHLYEAGWTGVAFGGSSPVPCYANASKGDKPLIRDFLARRHAGVWFAAIADSGQKHVLPFAPLNGPGAVGNVLFEEMLVRVPAEQSLIAEMTELLSCGATKDEIAAGDYYPRTWQNSLERVRRFEADNASKRHSGWFSLALWLAQRDEEEHVRRTEEIKARNPARRAVAGAKKRVHERAKRAPAAVVLGTVPSANEERGADNNKRERVGEPDATQAPDRKLTQQRLFDFD